MTDRVGQRLGNYRLVHLLGRGGFAEVYLGQHLRLNRQAAIKILHTQLADADDIENFQLEAQTVASLIHPHIVRVLDFDVKDGVPFLVIDYAPNGSLRRQHAKGVPLPLPTIVSYVKQIANALQYAHEQKLIHRDVKPENMLLGRRDEVLLSEFGIATIAQSSRYQGTQDMAGTITYMAPEQIQGKPRPASDQYALGVVVMVCGLQRGLPMAHASPLEALIRRCRSGMLQMVAMSSPIAGILILCWQCHGPPMAHASLRGVRIRRCRSG